VLPALVTRDATGKPDAVKYQLLPPLLLNELQRQQRTINSQTEELLDQAAQIANQARQIETLRARLERLEALLAR
jgi:hypothetical protein